MTDVELDPFAHSFHDDPYPIYRALRDEAPVYRNETQRFWALSRWDDVLEASLDWQTYSSAYGTTVEKLDPSLFEQTPMMLFLDPPRHDALRKLVMRAFTPKAVADLEVFIRDLAQRLLAPLVEGGGGDFVRAFSALLPMNVIFELVGVPVEDREQLRQWVDLSLERDPDPPYVPMRAMVAMGHMGDYWADLTHERRSDLRDDLVSRLIAAQIPGDDGSTTQLTDGEIIGFCSLIGAAGTETVTKLLANAAVLLADRPELWATLRANPTRIPDAVEEVLRYSSPSQYQGRTLTRDVELHGVTMPAGDRVLLLTAAANRDEREFPEPDEFLLDRPSHLALGFGHGIHLCLGAALARIESRIALEEFGSHFPAFTIDHANLKRVHMSNVHGYEHVPFHAAPIA